MYLKTTFRYQRLRLYPRGVIVLRNDIELYIMTHTLNVTQRDIT